MEHLRRFNRNRERSSAVTELLAQVESLRLPFDDYLQRVHTYLSWAKDCALSSERVVQSCIDLAETLTTIPELQESRAAKSADWERKRRSATATRRSSRTVRMELDPIYFAAILRGAKTFEGRAYKPDSDKNYPDIRADDQIQFYLSDREETFTEEARQLGIKAEDVMYCTVQDVFFAPTVHGVYQLPGFDGDAFQPMIQGQSELLQLQRAGVYYTFPGYPELIAQHGFLGIQVHSPRLMS
ncbi:MAG TPA: hypothetical protein VLF60_00590 [Candidatus Saccharimonadales bacterium]|nr:hypothetical protein [Candidatus Saccharimonadales bacterium]